MNRCSSFGAFSTGADAGAGYRRSQEVPVVVPVKVKVLVLGQVTVGYK